MDQTSKILIASLEFLEYEGGKKAFNLLVLS